MKQVCESYINSSSPNFVRDAWLALLEGKTDVYQDYLKVLKAASGRDIVPGFWKRQNTTTDELRASYVVNLDGGSNAVGSNDLDGSGCFLRGSP
ncbi:MAG: hypothetical protein AABY26_05455 [Nanoarchaeota archaeon]